MSDDLTPQPCDGCTLCCKVMGVSEIEKPPNKWCDLCEIGKGCKAYDDRPPGCQDFKCAYTTGLMGADKTLRPDHCHVVVSFTLDGRYPVAYVDTHRPYAWQQGEFAIWFEFMVRHLGKGIVVVGEKRMAVGSAWTKAEAEQALTEDVH